MPMHIWRMKNAIVFYQKHMRIALVNNKGIGNQQFIFYFLFYF